jgi:hypothetical protein
LYKLIVAEPFVNPPVTFKGTVVVVLQAAGVGVPQFVVHGGGVPQLVVHGGVTVVVLWSAAFDEN